MGCGGSDFIGSGWYLMNTCSAPANPLRKVLASLLIAGSTNAVPSQALAADADSRIVLQPELGCQATPKSGGILVIMCVDGRMMIGFAR
jgi:hypothetical protein